MTDIRELRLREADFLRRVRDVLCPLGGTIQPMTEEQKAALDMIGDRLIGFAHSETRDSADGLDSLNSLLDAIPSAVVASEPVAWRYHLSENTGPTFTANADDPFVKALRATPLYEAPVSATRHTPLDAARFPKAEPTMLERLAIQALNEVKAWRDSDGNEGFPQSTREKVEAVLMTYEQRRIHCSDRCVSRSEATTTLENPNG